MRFCKIWTVHIWLVAITLMIVPCLGVAGPLFPAIKASRSANGKYLVIIERRFDNPDSTASRRILSSTYVILQSEPFVNSRDRLETAASFWSDIDWQLSPQGEQWQGVLLPLISNDGQTLILVAPGVAMKPRNQEVIQIYKRKGNTATLVRTLRLSDVWSQQEIDSHAAFGATDETPQWYARSSLDFSEDNQELVYRSQWNDTVRIKLADGSTTFKAK